MDFKQSRDLDNHITGHYGEDQFKFFGDGRKDYSAHQEYCDNRSLDGIYSYDPANDGPEVETIVSILINHPELSPRFPVRLRK
jgi:hypothetical protein